MVREILDWQKEKIEETEMKSPKDLAKVFGLGFLEGWIDGSVLMYPFVLVALIIANKQLAKKQ